MVVAVSVRVEISLLDTNQILDPDDRLHDLFRGFVVCDETKGCPAVGRRVSIAREARSTAPKAPRPRSGLGTRRCFFNEECLDSTAGAI